MFLIDCDDQLKNMVKQTDPFGNPDFNTIE